MTNQDLAIAASQSEQSFQEALSIFVETTQVRLTDEHRKNYPKLLGDRPMLTVEPGSKNVRVVLHSGPSRAAYCFVRKADGAILKAAGWKAPAKHA